MARKRKTPKHPKVQPVELVERDLDEAIGASFVYGKITWTFDTPSSPSIKDGTSNTFFVGERNG